MPKQGLGPVRMFTAKPKTTTLDVPESKAHPLIKILTIALIAPILLYFVMIFVIGLVFGPGAFGVH